MRRLITLISAGRNRIVMIRRELPRTENADWVLRPYRTEVRRILLGVFSRSATCAAAGISVSKPRLANLARRRFGWRLQKGSDSGDRKLVRLHPSGREITRTEAWCCGLTCAGRQLVLGRRGTLVESGLLPATEMHGSGFRFNGMFRKCESGPSSCPQA